MARHLLDSDILIWVLRGKKEAIEFVRTLLKNEVPVISALAFFEIRVGARSSEEVLITNFLGAFDVVPVDHAIARQGGDYFRTYRKKGITLSIADALIAATAKIHDLTLVTQNTRHFPMRDLTQRSL